MAKKKASSDAPLQLFQHAQVTATSRRLRRQHALFIPRYLADAAANQQLAGTDQDKAYAIALRWADLESSGKLITHKETSIDTQFLDQLFGEGLGYSLKTTSPNAWHLEHKFTVTGVGICRCRARAKISRPQGEGPAVVIELKDAAKDLDRDRSNGRTAVQQCWDYLNALPDCPWGIVSNFSTIRLYHRSKGMLTHRISCRSSATAPVQRILFALLRAAADSLPSSRKHPERNCSSNKPKNARKKSAMTSTNRTNSSASASSNTSTSISQNPSMKPFASPAPETLDRLIFIAFCEDRGSCRTRIARPARRQRFLATASGDDNPRWKKFLGLFREVDKGGNLSASKPATTAASSLLMPGIDNLDFDGRSVDRRLWHPRHLRLLRRSECRSPRPPVRTPPSPNSSKSSVSAACSP